MAGDPKLDWESATPVPLKDEWDRAKPVEQDLGPYEAALRSTARVGWALPGIFGLDNARANAIAEWIKQRAVGGPVVDVEARTQAEREQNKIAERQHPYATIAGAVPAQAAVGAFGTAPLLLRTGVLAAGPLASAVGEAGLTSLLDLGQSQGYDPADRAFRSGLSGVTSAPAGAMGPLVLRNAARKAASQELAAAQRAAGGPVSSSVMEETPESILDAITGQIPKTEPDLEVGPSGVGRPSGRVSAGPAEPPTPAAPPVEPPPQVPPRGQEPQVPPEAASFVRRILERKLFGDQEPPTKEAVMLESRGVPLTMGQRTPRGPGNQIEEAATSLPIHGPQIKAQRDAAQSGWQNLVLNTARAPGTKRIPPSGDRWADLTSVYEGYNKAYGAIRDQKVVPAVVEGAEAIPLQSIEGQPGAVARAVANVDGIPPATQELVTKSVERQLSRLPTPQGEMPTVTAGDLLRVRRGLRDEVRKLVRAGGLEAEDRIRAYEAAEDAVTAALETQLDPKTSAALKAIDAQYRNYKMVERAFLYSADAPSGFTPNQLSRGVQAATDPGEFARGGGGPLRELSQAGRVVFEQQTPPTGARQIVLSALPKMVADPLIGGAVVRANQRAPAPPWSPPNWTTTVDWFK